MERLRPFDSCLTIGQAADPCCPHCLPTADAVLAMMDRFGIAEALVHEHHARTVYPIEHGNARLMKLIAGHDRLHACWVLEPPKKPGSGPAEEMVREMIDAGVRAARLRMRRVGSLPWLWDGLCAAMEARRLPCFLDFGHVSTTGDLRDADVDFVRRIALDHPRLPLILSHVMGGLGIHPAVLPLLRCTPNVYLDTTGLLDYWLETAAEISPRRALFATGAPFTDPGILISNIQYARGLSEQDKADLFGNNLRSLIGGVR